MKQILKLHEQKNLEEEISTAKDIFENIKKIDIDYNQENLLIFFLNSRRRLLKCEVLFKGCIDECSCDQRIIFRKALLYNAVAIIIAHNHPSNDLSPSKDDLKTANSLKKSGKIISIDFLDSVIFNKKEFYSLYDKMNIK